MASMHRFDAIADLSVAKFHAAWGFGDGRHRNTYTATARERAIGTPKEHRPMPCRATPR